MTPPSLRLLQFLQINPSYTNFDFNLDLDLTSP